MAKKKTTKVSPKKTTRDLAKKMPSKATTNSKKAAAATATAPSKKKAAKGATRPKIEKTSPKKKRTAPKKVATRLLGFKKTPPAQPPADTKGGGAIVGGTDPCTCGDAPEEHGRNPRYPGSTRCNAPGCDCVAYEADPESSQEASEPHRADPEANEADLEAVHGEISEAQMAAIVRRMQKAAAGKTDPEAAPVAHDELSEAQMAVIVQRAQKAAAGEMDPEVPRVHAADPEFGEEDTESTDENLED